VTPYLRPALHSILSQTLSDIEVLVVDNGTGLGLTAFGDEGSDPRLRLISFPTNRGIAPAHNAAVAQARGEYIALMDYDDVALPRRFERQVEALRREPGLGLVFTHTQEIDGSGRVLGPGFTLCSTRDQYEFSAYSMPATSPTSFGRRELFGKIPFREVYNTAPDVDFTARALELAPSLALAEVLLLYRRHSGQTTVVIHAGQQLSVNISRLLTARRRAGRPEQFLELNEELADWRQNPPPLAETYRWFSQRAMQENFPLLAAYLSRKLISVDRGPRAITHSLGLVAKALCHARGRRWDCLRMFLTGPLRTHGLNRL